MRASPFSELGACLNSLIKGFACRTIKKWVLYIDGGICVSEGETTVGCVGSNPTTLLNSRVALKHHPSPALLVRLPAIRKLASSMIPSMRTAFVLGRSNHTSPSEITNHFATHLQSSWKRVCGPRCRFWCMRFFSNENMHTDWVQSSLDSIAFSAACGRDGAPFSLQDLERWM